jgi:peptidoglycan/LPS O-acetylase OafA/YrhL
VPYLLGPRINHVNLTPLSDQLWYWAYLQNYHALKAVPGEFLGAFWTLAIEEQFYLVWPLMIFLCTRRQGLWVCLACVLGAIGYRSIMSYLGYSPESIGHLTPARVDALAIGSGIALLARGPEGFELVKKVSPYAIAAGVLILVMTFLRAGFVYHRDILMVTLGFSAMPLAYGGALVRGVTSAGVFARVLRSRLLGFFGRYSYGLYVIHFPVAVLFAKAGVVPYRFAGIDAPAPALLAYTISMMIVCVGCAWLTWHLYEKRFLSLKRHFVYDRGASRRSRTPAKQFFRPSL